MMLAELKEFRASHFIIISMTYLTACANSPARISMMGTEALQQVTSMYLCNAYALQPSKKVKSELLRRNEIPPEEWALIETQKIRIGMSELGFICSWGLPSVYGSVNETATQYGRQIQWVYRPCDYCTTKYVYTQGGKIVGWQN